MTRALALRAGAVGLCVSAALAGVGCASTSSRGPWTSAAPRGPGIALPSPNSLLLAAATGEGTGDEFSRNDVHMGSPAPAESVVEIIQRDWYQQERISFGRSYRDARFTTRIRERSVR